jgi:hypothetical protein
MKQLLFALCCSALLASIHQARASVIFSLGNNPQQPGEQNILFGTDQSGTTVVGTTDQGGTMVDFSSTTDVLMTTANGQAQVTAQDGAINDISIWIPGGTYQNLILNPFLGGVAAGPATLTVTTTTGAYTFDYSGGLGNGNNFVTIAADGGTLIQKVTIDAATGFADLKQPRIDLASASPATVPEPGTVLLVFGGMLALFGLIRVPNRGNRRP